MKEIILDLPNGIKIEKIPDFLLNLKEKQITLEEVKKSLFLILSNGNDKKLKLIFPKESEKRANGFDKESVNKFLSSFLNITKSDGQKILKEIINELDLQSFSDYEFKDFVSGGYKTYFVKKFTQNLLSYKFGNNNYKIEKLFYYSFEGASKSIIREQFDLINIKLAKLIVSLFKKDLGKLLKNFSLDISSKLLEKNFLVKYVNKFYLHFSNIHKSNIQLINIINLFGLFKEYLETELKNDSFDKNLIKPIVNQIKKKDFYNLFVFLLLKNSVENKNNLLRLVMYFFSEEKSIYLEKNKYKILKLDLIKDNTPITKVYNNIIEIVKKYFFYLNYKEDLVNKIDELKIKYKNLNNQRDIINEQIQKILSENKLLGHKLRKINLILKNKEFPELENDKNGLGKLVLDFIKVPELEKKYKEIKKQLVLKLTSLASEKRELISKRAKIVSELKGIDIAFYESKLKKTLEQIESYQKKYTKIYGSIYKSLLYGIIKLNN